MPMKPAFICKYPGCQQLEIGKGYCKGHKDKGSQRDRHKQSMYDYAWEKASKAYLVGHPWCCDCGGVATEVHHRIKHMGSKELFWNENNWMGLCHRCHSKRTRRGE